MYLQYNIIIETDTNVVLVYDEFNSCFFQYSLKEENGIGTEFLATNMVGADLTTLHQNFLDNLGSIPDCPQYLIDMISLRIQNL